MIDAPARVGGCLTAVALLLCAVGASAAPRVLSGPPQRESQELQWAAYRVFDAQDGLPQAAVFALAQDREGLVYAGTEDGVARFDGARWQALPLPPSPAPPNVVDIVIDAHEGLWAASDMLGLMYRAPGSAALRTLALEPGRLIEVVDLALAGEDLVWVAAESGLYRCNPGTCVAIAVLAGRPVVRILPGDGPEGACLWVAIEGEGLFRLDAPDSALPRLSPRLLSRADGLPNDAIRSLAFWQGALWIGTGRGLARWADDELTVYARDSGFGEGIVHAIEPGRDARDQPILRIGQRPGGVVEIEPSGHWRRLGTSTGLPEDNAFSLLQAPVGAGRDPVLWIGTVYSGVARYEPGSWRAMDERSGLPHRAVMGAGRVTLHDGRQRYWLGTVRGSVAWQGGRWQSWLPDGLEREIVFDVARTRDAIWLATSVGLFAWRAGGVRRYDIGNSAIPGVIVLGVHVQQRADGSERIWATTRHGIAFVDGRDGIMHRDPEPERLLGDAYFRDFIETRAPDGQRTLWAAGQGGVVFDRGQGWQPLPSPCLVHPDVMDMNAQRGDEGERALWLGTRGGITRIDLDRFACDSLGVDVLEKPTVYQLQFDRRERAYLFGYDGVRRLTFNAETPRDLRRATIERFEFADGLPSLEFNRGAGLVDRDGRIWGGSSGGVAIYDPSVEPVAGAPAPLRLIAAHVLPEGTELGPGATLASGDSGLRFRYALLTARREHRIRYRTELVGLDEAPSEWSRDSSIAYPRLPPGDYRFRVWGRDEHAVVSGPREIAFRVAYPLWQQPWALVAYALALLGTGVLLGRLRARALAQRAKRLEQLVGARTAELAEANQRLEVASLTDPLTGLGNRRCFHLRAPDWIGDGQPLALLLVDLDHFKRINDARGHDAGDAVLREFAHRAKAALAGAELAVRWGGEEFLLALPGCGVEQAAARAQALLQLVRSEPFALDSGAIEVTCSIGWVCLPWRIAHAPGPGIDQALTLADLALYRAKRDGRDRAIGVSAGDVEDALLDGLGLRVRWIDVHRPDNLVPFRR